MFNRESSLIFTEGDREVLLLVEAGRSGVPTVMIRPPNPNERFGLHEAIPAFDPAYHAQRSQGIGSAMTDEQFRALLEHDAVFFHANWEGLLADHGEIFSAVMRYRKTNTGSGDSL